MNSIYYYIDKIMEFYKYNESSLKKTISINENDNILNYFMNIAENDFQRPPTIQNNIIVTGDYLYLLFFREIMCYYQLFKNHNDLNRVLFNYFKNYKPDIELELSYNEKNENYYSNYSINSINIYKDELDKYIKELILKQKLNYHFNDGKEITYRIIKYEDINEIRLSIDKILNLVISIERKINIETNIYNFNTLNYVFIGENLISNFCNIAIPSNYFIKCFPINKDIPVDEYYSSIKSSISDCYEYNILKLKNDYMKCFILFHICNKIIEEKIYSLLFMLIPKKHIIENSLYRFKGKTMRYLLPVNFIECANNMRDNIKNKTILEPIILLEFLNFHIKVSDYILERIGISN